MHSSMTKKEKENFDELKFGFNIIPENDDYNYKVSRRIEVSRIFAKKLLIISFALNVITICCFGLALILTYLKPYPQYYGSTPNGKIFPLETMKLPKR